MGVESSNVLSKLRLVPDNDTSTRLRLNQRENILPKFTLSILFVTHGGGWVSGSHISEEAWLLRSLYNHFNLIIMAA